MAIKSALIDVAKSAARFVNALTRVAFTKAQAYLSLRAEIEKIDGDQFEAASQKDETLFALTVGRISFLPDVLTNGLIEFTSSNGVIVDLKADAPASVAERFRIAANWNCCLDKNQKPALLHEDFENGAAELNIGAHKLSVQVVSSLKNQIT